ncbi:hypothetical protein CJ030_MR7G021952 [Morella rubra]|uniref:Uncharacterized protein n=1 Tax=Morella rubra TaxID=262757 RepID=A0A6A1V1P5_9ROSI|nr:hypothetical protein CJ030_MR7G021952 [Morella rubra]
MKMIISGSNCATYSAGVGYVFWHAIDLYKTNMHVHLLLHSPVRIWRDILPWL